MAKEGSIAPKERVNIRYKAATGDMKEERELPLKLLFIGDYTLRDDDTPLAERAPINVDKDNFSKVMKGQKLSLDLNVKNKLEEGQEGEDMAVKLKFDNLKDFAPEAVAKQVPELNAMLELRHALTALKSPLGNNKDFKKKIRDIVGTDEGRAQVLKELGLGE
ncbi:MAG: type VI secretion system contractile sheath small subunit [Planctomycetes bacterium]|nr:type VI secretion system contractile sheath small subunit [Planctomycetota bacterium]